MKPRPAGAFLAGAGSRLLPASVPFRYFGAAVAFHLLAWLALLAGADRLPRFSGGLGWPLAALHLATLGVLTMTAIGASLQLLPVATRQPLRSARWPALIWWLYVPGVAAVACGMGAALPLVLAAGTAAVAVALAAWAVLLAANLIGARGMPGVVGHGWSALTSLAVMLVAAIGLVAIYLGLPLIDRSTALALHIAFAAYGFMGLLALGLSYILLPMFALAAAPDDRVAIASCGFGVAALIAAGFAAAGVAGLPLRLAAIALGAVAVAAHLRLMHAALRSGMRRPLGRWFALIRVGWAGLAASLLAALALVLELPLAGAPTLFALLLVGGWLISFVLGVLQRIVPFLASMHSARGSARAPTPSSLTVERPLSVHYHCHLAALAGLLGSVVADSAALAGLSAAVGAVGAAAYGVFFVTVLRRMNRSAASAPGRVAPTA